MPIRLKQLPLPGVPQLPPQPRSWDAGVRYQALERSIRLSEMVKGRHFCQPLGELSQALGVCERTVRRYLDALSLAGVPVPPTAAEYFRDQDYTAGGAR